MYTKIVSYVLVMCLGAATAAAVDYDGEKSDMLEMPYKMCMNPPEISEAMEKGIWVVNLLKAKELYDQNARFFDAREKRHYRQQHIKGAKRVRFDQSKAQYVAIDLPRDKSESLVFYCYGESCANSYEAALAVKNQGYRNVYWLINGFGAWKKSGYPVE